MVDRAGRPLYGVRDPERIYERIEAIPPVVVATLLFIEDRQLLDYFSLMDRDYIARVHPLELWLVAS